MKFKIKNLEAFKSEASKVSLENNVSVHGWSLHPDNFQVELSDTLVDKLNAIDVNLMKRLRDC